MSLRDHLRVTGPAALVDIDPDGTPGLPGRATGPHPKSWAREQLSVIGERLATYQEQLYASAKSGASHARVLLVLQAMDCGGKDGTVKKVAGAMNPAGVHIVGFGQPTAEELAHDFLWRIRNALPPPGFVGVFNRSHYEDVLIVRVHDLVPGEVWRARYEQINDFEHELTSAGFVLVKVMLHISAEEQRERLDERLHDPTKYWKYNPADLDERAKWADYQAAYNEALTSCSPPSAPWYVVPANRKWYRDWAVATLLDEVMGEMGLTYPPAAFDVKAERARLR